MSSRKTHAIAGAVAGGAYVLARLPAGQKPINNLAELLGAILGGMSGARMPDVIEPPIHSHHRSTFHSFGAAGLITYGMVQNKVSIPTVLRERAANMRLKAEQFEASGQSAFAERLAEFFFHFAAGYVAALPAGYLSHLACDATTPRSIPLL